MALRIRMAYAPGFKLGVSIEKPSDGTKLDFADGMFKAKVDPVQPILAFPERPAPYLGLYALDLNPTPWPDDWYQVSVHLTSENNQVIATEARRIHNADDAPVPPVELNGLKFLGVIQSAVIAPAPVPSVPPAA